MSQGAASLAASAWRARLSQTPRRAIALRAAVAATLWADIPFDLVETHVNDPAFADLVAERYLGTVSAAASRA